MATEVIVVVGKNPLDDKFGFDAVGTMRYGSFIPNELADTLVASLLMDESAGSVVLTFDGTTNVLGTNAAITLESGATIDVTGVAGVYTAGTPSTAFTDVVVAKIDGVQNMMIGPMAGFASATTAGDPYGFTIAITLDVAATETKVADWLVDIDAGTNNVVTAATVSGTTVTLTVTDFISNGEVILVDHVRTTQIDTITDGSVTNAVAVLETLVSANTTSSTTIDIVWSGAPLSDNIGEWSAISDGTANVITDVSTTASTTTITVTDAILTTEVVTVSHTHGSGVVELTDQAVTNNEA